MYKIGDEVLIKEGSNCVYNNEKACWTPSMSAFLVGKRVSIINIIGPKYYIDVRHIPQLRGASWYVIDPWIDNTGKHYIKTVTNI